MTMIRRTSLPRTPRVDNKYCFYLGDLKYVSVGNYEALKKTPFTYDENTGSYLLTACTVSEQEKSTRDDWGEVIIRFYENATKTGINNISVKCHTEAGKYGYSFNGFFKARTIENLGELEVQEITLECINRLLDEGILKLPEEYTERKKRAIEECNKSLETADRNILKEIGQ